MILCLNKLYKQSCAVLDIKTLAGREILYLNFAFKCVKNENLLNKGNFHENRIFCEFLCI